MPSHRETDDARSLHVLLDMLRYIERELGVLKAPMPETGALVGQAAHAVENALKPRKRRRQDEPVG